jgi:DNA polymerase III subunit delta
VANWDANQIFKHLSAQPKPSELASVYLFYGEESYLIQQAFHQLKSLALEGGAADFNFDSYYAADCDVAQVRDVFETLPMMAERRVVVIHEAQDLTDKEWAVLEPSITQPPEGSLLILLGRKIDKRKKFFRIISETQNAVEFKKPYENQMAGWIRYICKSFELEIDEEALRLLYKLTGSHLEDIEGEVKKLRLYLGDRHQIEVKDVEACVSRTREDTIFELTDSVGQRQRVTALVKLSHLIDQGQSQIGIVSMISRHIRILLAIKHGIESGMVGAKLASFAQVPSYYLQNYVDQSRAWPVPRLENTLVLLSETDKELKSSTVSSQIWLEKLIIECCSAT